jgi:hypothetical protein
MEWIERSERVNVRADWEARDHVRCIEEKCPSNQGEFPLWKEAVGRAGSRSSWLCLRYSRQALWSPCFLLCLGCT